MDPGFPQFIACPSCGVVGSTRIQTEGLVCRDCDAVFERRDGYFDLTSGSEQTATTPEQRFMESELIARLYDRLWRPAFVRVVAGSGAGARAGGFTGELFIHKNCLAMEDRGGPWLDLSCGPGLFLRAMGASAPGELIIGVDISRAMLERAVSRCKGYSNVILIRGDAHDLPFAADSFGGINHGAALHAYDDPHRAFEEILRVLRPGGVYVASTFAQARSLAGRIAARVAGIRRFHPPELRAQLSRIGFADYEEIRLGDAFIFRARKP